MSVLTGFSSCGSTDKTSNTYDYLVDHDDDYNYSDDDDENDKKTKVDVDSKRAFEPWITNLDLSLQTTDVSILGAVDDLDDH